MAARELFGDGMRLSIARVPMGSCDYGSLPHSTYDDVPGDLSLVHFNISRDEQWKIPMARDVRRAANTSDTRVRFFASPWSPPGWMKLNGNINGTAKGCFSGMPGVLDSYALYFSKFLSAWEAEGLPFWAVTVQNEPTHCQSDGTMPECCLSATEEVHFVRGFLGPRLRIDHPAVEIWSLDDNKNNVADWAAALVVDTDALKYVSAVGIHWYAGEQFARLKMARESLPESIRIIGTEACIRAQNGWEGALMYAADIFGDLNGGATGWMAWNAVLPCDHWDFKGTSICSPANAAW